MAFVSSPFSVLVVEFVRHGWDPLSSSQTANLVAIVKKLLLSYPSVHAASRHTEVKYPAPSCEEFSNLVFITGVFSPSLPHSPISYSHCPYIL